MIYVGGDKHGYEVIRQIEAHLSSQGIPFENLGVEAADEELSLETLIPKLTGKVLENPGNLGILSCGTGIGIEVGANRFKGIRAARVVDAQSAGWSREYDNCNVLCLPGWGLEKEQVESIVKAWLAAKFDGDPDRVKMLEAFDAWGQ